MSHNQLANPAARRTQSKGADPARPPAQSPATTAQAPANDLRRPMPMRPAVGVVIPVRNRPASIVNAIRSVLNQTLPALRIIVVDDGSTDSTAHEVHRMAQGVGNLSVVTIPHSGPATARNAGLQAFDADMRPPPGGSETSGETLVAFLDSDDIWPPDFLLRAQRRLWDRPDLSFVVADFWEGDHPTGPRLFSARGFDADPWCALRRQTPHIMSSAVFRRTALDDRPFPEGSSIGEDGALLIRLLASGAKSAWIAGRPVVAASIPPGDQERLTTQERSKLQNLRDRIAAAENYAAALRGSTAAIPQRLAGRLLAARWVAVLWFAIAALERRSVVRALAGLWRCGALAVALGVIDLCRARPRLRPTRRADRQDRFGPSHRES